MYDSAACRSNRYNHAVIIVGFGKDEPSGKDFWIVRNSWGSTWGTDGYFLIRRGVNRCNIEKYTGYFIF